MKKIKSCYCQNTQVRTETLFARKNETQKGIVYATDILMPNCRPEMTRKFLSDKTQLQGGLRKLHLQRETLLRILTNIVEYSKVYKCSVYSIINNIKDDPITIPNHET